MGYSTGFVRAMLVIALIFPGCKRSTAPTTAASASASAALSGAPLPKNADADLYRRLVDLSKACKVVAEQGSVNCPQGEHRKLINEFTTRQRKREQAVATFAAALASNQPEVQTVAANILSAAFRSNWGSDVKPGSVPRADANELVRVALKLPRTQSRQAVPAAVNAAMLANQSQTLYTALDAAADAEIRIIGYRYLMTHGRLDAFKKVQEIAKDQNPAIAMAALESPRNMQSWTPEEQAAICPWASGFLADTRQSVASRAASLLGNCSGDFVDKLLDAGEASLKAGRSGTLDVTAYRELCGPKQRTQGTGPSQAQCSRARALLEKVADSKTLDEQTRSSALLAIAYQWPDDKTLKLAKKLEKSSEQRLADHAKRTIARIEQRSALAKRGPGALGSSRVLAPMPPPAASR